MKVRLSRLVVGPRGKLGKRNVRYLHILSKRSEDTLCGSTPLTKKSRRRGLRWFKWGSPLKKEANLKSKLLKCSNCADIIERLESEQDDSD